SLHALSTSHSSSSPLLLPLSALSSPDRHRRRRHRHRPENRQTNNQTNKQIARMHTRTHIQRRTRKVSTKSAEKQTTRLTWWSISFFPVPAPTAAAVD